MRPLLIDQKLKDEIKKLVNHAEKNPVKINPGDTQVKPIGDNSNHVVLAEVGYRVVYSIENQPKGDVRHLSMSVDAVDKLPSVQAVIAIMKLIGFENELENCKISIEEVDSKLSAINILEVLELRHQQT